MRRAAVLVVLLASACKEGSTPTIVAPADPQARPDTTASAAPSPPSAPAPAPTAAPAPSALTGYPPLTDACATAADCASTNYGPDCCFRCETSVGDKAWATKVDAFCAAREKAGGTKACPITACSRDEARPSPILGYINAIPRCLSGHCRK